MNEIQTNSTDQTKNNAILNDLLMSETVEVKKLDLRSNAKIVVKTQPSYLPIIVGGLVFMATLHILGMILVPRYSSFSDMHILSSSVVVASMGILSALRLYASKI